jgi:hypothetical protein
MIKLKIEATYDEWSMGVYGVDVISDVRLTEDSNLDLSNAKIEVDASTGTSWGHVFSEKEHLKELASGEYDWAFEDCYDDDPDPKSILYDKEYCNIAFLSVTDIYDCRVMRASLESLSKDLLETVKEGSYKELVTHTKHSSQSEFIYTIDHSLFKKEECNYEANY